MSSDRYAKAVVALLVVARMRASRRQRREAAVVLIALFLADIGRTLPFDRPEAINALVDDAASSSTPAAALETRLRLLSVDMPAA